MVGFDDADWEELGQVVGGDPERGDVIRRLVTAFLKRPGAKMPRRKDYEQLEPFKPPRKRGRPRKDA